MRWFKNTKIKFKLLINFIIVAVFTLVVGILGTTNMKNINSNGQSMYRNNLLPIMDLSQVQKVLLLNHETFSQMVTQKNNSGLEAVLKEDDTSKAENDRLLAEYRNSNLSQSERNEYINLEDYLGQYRNTKSQIADLVKQGKYDEASLRVTDLNNSMQGVSKSLGKLMDISKDLAETATINNQNTYIASSRTMIIMIVVSIALAVAIGMFLSAFISRKLKELTNTAQRISEGDIDIHLKLDSEDELGVLAASFEKMVESINKLVEETNMLTGTALEGKLSTRGNTKLFKGAFADIIEGINRTLDAVTEPIKESARVLEEMSKGNLKANVKGDYKGDHALIKNALNDTINTLRSHIEEISKVLTEMAEGNLKVQVKGMYNGDLSAMKEATNKIIASLNRILKDINTAAQQVASGSAQVSSSSQNLSQGSTEQASAVQEITSSITELAAQTRENAVSASEANEVADRAKIDADSGKEKMLEMLKAMEEINKSSSNISNIIKVIDEIAFQTNILALNAAVEAARAGQHGKGFAVVAEEVRNLAARSANAAKETTEMIEESIRKSEKGKEIASDTADALNKIIENISKVSKLVGEITEASKEQADGISQINEAIEQVSKVTQINTATSEESASASEELSSQAIMLKDMVAQFKLKNSSAYSSGKNNRFNVAETLLNNRNYQGKGMVSDTEPKPTITLDDSDFGKY